MDPILIDFFNDGVCCPFSPPSSSKVAKVSLSFFILFATDSTALEAQPATLRRRERCWYVFSFSLIVVALLFVRFLDKRELGREGVLPSTPDSPRDEFRRFEDECMLPSPSEEPGEPLSIGDRAFFDKRRNDNLGRPLCLWVLVGELVLNVQLDYLVANLINEAYSWFQSDLTSSSTSKYCRAKLISRSRKDVSSPRWRTSSFRITSMCARISSAVSSLLILLGAEDNRVDRLTNVVLRSPPLPRHLAFLSPSYSASVFPLYSTHSRKQT